MRKIKYLFCFIIFLLGIKAESQPSEYGFGHDLFVPFDIEHRTRQFDLSKDLGLNWMRTVATWGQIEKEKGTYDWSLFDKIFKESGPDKKILLTLYSSNGLYCKYQNIKKNLPKPYNDPNRSPSSIPEDMEAYKRFLRAIVSRYKSKIKYWQIENEVYNVQHFLVNPLFGYAEMNFPIGTYWLGPIDEYLELLKVSYETIKGVDPEAKVLLSGVYMEPWVPGDQMPPEHPFFKEMLERLDKTLKYAKNYFDILDFHHYFSPESIIPRIDFLEDRMHFYGYKKEIWITESGGISLDLHPEFKNTLHTYLELKQQAEEIVKFYVKAFERGVKKIFWFEISPTSKTINVLQTWPFGRMYLTEDIMGYKKKPAYKTLKVMVKKLKNFIRVTKLDTEYDFYKFEFENKNPVYVLWSDREKQIDISGFVPTIEINAVKSNENNEDFVTTLMTSNKVSVGKAPLFIESSETNESYAMERYKVKPSYGCGKIEDNSRNTKLPSQIILLILLFSPLSLVMLLQSIYQINNKSKSDIDPFEHYL